MRLSLTSPVDTFGLGHDASTDAAWMPGCPISSHWSGLGSRAGWMVIMRRSRPSIADPASRRLWFSLSSRISSWPLEDRQVCGLDSAERARALRGSLHWPAASQSLGRESLGGARQWTWQSHRIARRWDSLGGGSINRQQAGGVVCATSSKSGREGWSPANWLMHRAICPSAPARTGPDATSRHLHSNLDALFESTPQRPLPPLLLLLLLLSLPVRAHGQPGALLSSRLSGGSSCESFLILFSNWPAAAILHLPPNFT